ncbi:MAG TPA: LytTR family DNA-binding domain-containing protein [Longimicrobiaceae bacterium]|nr:LytTR family DNA-binding domain-containing protein [Longimicrobiaceae bacterium]
MTLRVLVVDDEPLARRGILARLRRAGGVEVVGECASGREAVDAIRGLAPDLVFLDVQMPGTDGFGVVEAVGPERVPEVVFVTAYDEHALRAFEAQALDYLLKPVDDERFARALERARRRVEERRHGALGRRVAAALAEAGAAAPPSAPERPAERFLVRRGGRVQVVHADEIDWVEAAGDYVSLHAGGATHLLRETMAALEARLDPARFLRIHRSTIVNVERIRELHPHFNREYVVVLRDGTRLKLSRSYRGRLDALFGGEA